MIYGSICSGIEAATVAWHPLGWRPAFFAEIDAFPRAVLAHHYPDVPLHGDFTTIEAGQYAAIDVLVGGTPCQSFSVAGLRKGLADDRGNLALEFLRLAQRLRPKWLVWENVPGVLSSNGGRDFGAFLGGLVECGYGFAYRVLDAQYFGLAQRRKRVFVVGCLGDWRGAAAVLFERASLRGDPAPRREAWKGVAHSVIKGAAIGRQPEHGPQFGEVLTDGTCYTLNCTETHAVARCVTTGEGTRQDYETTPLVAHSLRAEGFDAPEDETGRGTPLVPVHREVAPTLTGSYGKQPESSDTSAGPMLVPVAFDARQSDVIQYGDKTGPLDTDGTSIGILSGDAYADAGQTGPVEALRALRESVDEETLVRWSLGILAAFWPKEVLRPEVHGGGVRCAAQPKRGLVNVALSRSQAGSSWAVLDLWEAGGDGCPPPGWQPPEQLAGELGAALSRLPYAPSPAEAILRAMWAAYEGAGLLREALSAAQAARRSVIGEGEPAHRGVQVRRLAPEEAEALQGFPRGYTLIPYRGKPAADGPRYKALGNSMAVPVMRWIGRRIQAVNKILALQEAA